MERVATERYLERAAAVELAAIEDHAFHKLLDTAQYGAASARRMISYGTRVMNAMISLIAAAGVLTVLHPALLPLLVTMTLPSAWSALTDRPAALRVLPRLGAARPRGPAARQPADRARGGPRDPGARGGPLPAAALPRDVGDGGGGAGPPGRGSPPVRV